MTDKTSDTLLSPPRLWSAQEVLTTDRAPRRPGIYAWYFREIPPGVPTEGCITALGCTLLYVGISPQCPPANGRKPSQGTVRSRLRSHFRGNASESTLRQTLGCLLAAQLGIELRRVGRGERLTFGTGEARLSEWMGQNALVCWAETREPWIVEDRLIRAVCLPLNLHQNAVHPFHSALSACRAAAKLRARQLPICLR